ncbi:hypothetical protein HNR53_000095 [Bacillus benzoevorans]|uniref:Uncharacterized protein n=1 Tax=Bacillus benzoevorans TaxID=1456 RepID=A0A7X0HPS7_9BACI|nr:hypothetical protein [Bacillus benzoevorans]
MIGVEGTKTPPKMLAHFHRAWADSRKLIQCPAGIARQTRPRRHEVARRLGGRPRKAKCLERKSTTKFNRAFI